MSDYLPLNKKLRLVEEGENEEDRDISSNSKFGQYFTIKKNNSSQERTATCRLCERSYKMTNGNTTSLSKHLQNCHRQEYEVLFKNKKIVEVKKILKNSRRCKHFVNNARIKTSSFGSLFLFTRKA